MGLRNPFRFAVNRSNGDVYLGDYSPDAGAANPQRGPAGQGRWMLIKRPANYGWPYCATPDMPYVDYCREALNRWQREYGGYAAERCRCHRVE
jgi:cytochrome c